MLSFCSLARAQYPEGEALFKRGDYAKAEAYYQSQLRQNPSNMTLRYRTGKCQLLQKHYEQAINTLEPLKKRSNTPKELYVMLGEAYFGCYRFAESVESYETYRSKGGEQDVTVPLRRSRQAVHMLESVDDIVVIDSTVVELDKILSVYRLAKEIGTLTKEPKDSVGLLTGCISGRNDHKIFAKNCDSTISLFESYGLLDGTWSTPTPLTGAVNTKDNQNFPFIHPDGVTLYFASDDPSGMGGYDIFRANNNGNGFLEPHNLGFPYNSTANDYLMVVDEYTGIGWFATDRRQPKGKVMVYTFVPNAVRVNVEGTEQERITRAQMKGYAVTEKTIETSSNSEETASISGEGFVIKDGLAYHSIQQFQSENAKQHFAQYQVAQQAMAQAESQLADLRKAYGTADEAQRKTIANQISILEQQLLSLRTTMKQEAKLTRNCEIEWLNTHQ